MYNNACLLQHEDMEFWQIDESNNCIYTSNFYSAPSEIINESNNLIIKIIIIIIIYSSNFLFGIIDKNASFQSCFKLNSFKIANV